jgi:hypothetical protein
MNQYTSAGLFVNNADTVPRDLNTTLFPRYSALFFLPSASEPVSFFYSLITYYSKIFAGHGPRFFKIDIYNETKYVGHGFS